MLSGQLLDEWSAEFCHARLELGDVCFHLIVILNGGLWRHLAFGKSNPLVHHFQSLRGRGGVNRRILGDLLAHDGKEYRINFLKILFCWHAVILPAWCAGKARKCMRHWSAGPVAQRLEQQTHNLLVVGSNPTGPTKFSITYRFSVLGCAAECAVKFFRHSLTSLCRPGFH